MLNGYFSTTVTARTNIVLHLTNNYTNSASDGYKVVSQVAANYPTLVSDYMLFNGTTQIVKYADKPEFHVVAPYSIELEFSANALTGTRWIATCGEGYQAGWPEWDIVLNGSTLSFSTSLSNNGDDTTATYSTSIVANRWYRVGLMFYTDSASAYHARGYINNVKMFDVPCSQPYDSPYGIAVGGDYSAVATRLFNGKIRNVTVAQSLFWTV